MATLPLRRSNCVRDGSQSQGQFVIQAPIQVAQHLIFIDDEQSRTDALDEPALLRLQSRHHDGRRQILRQIAGGDAHVPSSRAPLGQLVIGQGASGDGIDGLTAVAALVGPQFKDQSLARAGRRLHDNIFAFTQSSDGLLLPKVWNGHAIERRKGFQLFGNGQHVVKIIENGSEPTRNREGSQRISLILAKDV